MNYGISKLQPQFIHIIWVLNRIRYIYIYSYMERSMKQVIEQYWWNESIYKKVVTIYVCIHIPSNGGKLNR